MNKDHLIKKWLANNLTDAEQKAFEQSEDYELNRKIIESAKHFKAPHFSAEEGYDKLKIKLESKSAPVIKLKLYKILYRIAAVFVIGLCVYLFFLFSSTNTIETLAGQKITFELPDASTVTLNSVSEISYSKYRWNNNREVKLYGEAFFKVAKGSRFDVLTSAGTVSVLGTQFNINNRDNYFEVKCFEGIVMVISNGKSQRLTKGNTYRMINNIVTLDSTSSNEPEWLDNRSNFKSVPLYLVLNEMERQYNVIIITQKVNTKLLYTGGFVNDNIEQALETITVPFDLTYKNTEPNIITLYRSE